MFSVTQTDQLLLLTVRQFQLFFFNALLIPFKCCCFFYDFSLHLRFPDFENFVHVLNLWVRPILKEWLAISVYCIAKNLQITAQRLASACARESRPQIQAYPLFCTLLLTSYQQSQCDLVCVCVRVMGAIFRSLGLLVYMDASKSVCLHG